MLLKSVVGKNLTKCSKNRYEMGHWCFENEYHRTDLMIMVYIELSKNLFI